MWRPASEFGETGMTAVAQRIPGAACFEEFRFIANGTERLAAGHGLQRLAKRLGALFLVEDDNAPPIHRHEGGIHAEGAPRQIEEAAKARQGDELFKIVHNASCRSLKTADRSRKHNRRIGGIGSYFGVTGVAERRFSAQSCRIKNRAAAKSFFLHAERGLRCVGDGELRNGSLQQNSELGIGIQPNAER